MITLQDVAVGLVDELEKGLREGKFIPYDENSVGFDLPESPEKLFGKYERELQNLFREERLKRGMRKDLLSVLQVWVRGPIPQMPHVAPYAIYIDFTPSYGWVTEKETDL
jgi:hypothetical protein